MPEDRIVSIRALEVLDSRGNPTVEVQIELADGAKGHAIVPSGASTGSLEAHELRDGDPKRYGGKGVLQAVANVNNLIAPRVVGSFASAQDEIDRGMIELDGTDEQVASGRQRAARRVAGRGAGRGGVQGRAVVRSLGGRGANLLPMPMLNVLNGGKHATRSTDFQEFMLAPVGLPTFADALRAGSEIYQALKKLLDKRGLSTNVGDEGGFAPSLGTNVAAVELLVEAITAAGYRPGDDVALALDPASTELYENGKLQPGEREPQPHERRDGRPVGRLVRQLSHRQHRRRAGGGRLGGLGPADVAARQDRAAGWR